MNNNVAIDVDARIKQMTRQWKTKKLIRAGEDKQKATERTRITKQVSTACSHAFVVHLMRYTHTHTELSVVNSNFESIAAIWQLLEIKCIFNSASSSLFLPRIFCLLAKKKKQQTKCIALSQRAQQSMLHFFTPFSEKFPRLCKNVLHSF